MKCCSQYHAGLLREPVKFWREAQVPDGAGGYTRSLAAISGAPTMAQVTPMSGGEVWRSQRIEATGGFRVLVRYFPGLDMTDVIRIRGRDHNITHVKNVDLADTWLVISVDEGRAI